MFWKHISHSNRNKEVKFPLFFHIFWKHWIVKLQIYKAFWNITANNKRIFLANKLTLKWWLFGAFMEISLKTPLKRDHSKLKYPTHLLVLKYCFNPRRHRKYISCLSNKNSHIFKKHFSVKALLLWVYAKIVHKASFFTISQKTLFSLDIKKICVSMLPKNPKKILVIWSINLRSFFELMQNKILLKAQGVQGGNILHDIQI